MLPEEYRNIAGFWVMPFSMVFHVPLASSSHIFGVCITQGVQAFSFVVEMTSVLRIQGAWLDSLHSFR